MPLPVQIRRFAPGKLPRAFVRLGREVNAGDPLWVHPLRVALDPLLDGKHPFHQHSDVAFFLAERGDEAVGRVAAVVNHRSNEFHDEKVGTFGLFECRDDAEAANALLGAAAGWLRERGMDAMRGPFNLSTNDELHSPGVLVEGFDTPPVFMMGHNPPYYGRLMEGAGLAKVKDLLAYWRTHGRPGERLVEGVKRLAKREGWKVRSLQMKHFRAEVGRIMEVYNSAWERNWGFVPMTEAEFDTMAKEFKPVMDPDLCLLAETEAGEPIGFLLAIPDLNLAIRHLPDGKLLPFGWAKFLWHKRRIRRLRVLTLGLKPGHQASGIGAAMYLHGFAVAANKGYQDGEASWILEDNHRMRQALEKLDTKVYKVYRVYERAL